MNIAQALSELDLRPGATEQEIRSAYRTLVAKWHPDKHQNDPIRLREAELRIKNINRAFEALQKAGFRTEKPSGKGGQKTENPKGSSQSKSPEPPEVPKDGRSKKKAQKRSDEDSMKHGRKSRQWPVVLIGAAVLFAAGILAGRLLAPDNPRPSVDVICSEQEKEIAKLKKTNNQLSNEKTDWEKAKNKLEREKNALKLQVLDMQGAGYVLSQVEALKFSREQLLTLLQTCLAKDSPSEMSDLLFEAAQPKGDPLLRKFTKRFWVGIGKSGQDWIQKGPGPEPPSPSEKPIPPKNEAELQQAINEIITAKENRWFPLYLEMLKARVDSCNDAEMKMSQLLKDVSDNAGWVDQVNNRRKELEQEREDVNRIIMMKANKDGTGSIALLEQEFVGCRFWDWVDLKTPNQVGVRSLYEADVIFKNAQGKNRLEHWPKNLLVKGPGSPRPQGAIQFDHDYRILFRSALSPELVVIEVNFINRNNDRGVWLWNTNSGLLFPLGKIPYVARKLSEAEIRHLGLR
jgi:curved DNA-binding protein CbpA